MNRKYTDSEDFSIDALRSGDRVEFARLLDVYSGPIYRLAIRILGNSQDAEDVLQDTFIKAFRAIGDFEGKSTLSTWLFRIATNEALMLVRKRKPDLMKLVEIDQDDENEQSAPMQLTDWCCLPESELASVEARKYLDEAVNRLSPALRFVFLLRDVEGLSIRETAEMLGITEVNVKTRLLRARMRLREALSNYYSGHQAEDS